MSIKNLKSFLKISDNVTASDVEFFRLEDEDGSFSPWKVSVGITSMNLDYIIHEEDIVPYTKKEVSDFLENRGSSSPPYKGSRP
jgi:hypothetical protein